MGLFQKACETFDTFQDMIGKQIEGQEPLAPCSHSVIRADLEITIDQDGRFVAARAVDKKEPKIIIPVTEESAKRSSTNIAPHPLCDKLKYLASYNESSQKRYQVYIEQLESWINSSCQHPMLLPILLYVRNGTIIADLLSANLLKLNQYGLPNKEDSFICWRIVGIGDNSGATWESRSLFEAFQRYYMEKKSYTVKALCMVSGEAVPLANKHPKGIVSNCGNAKLVSDNDKDNFTFLGRFTEPAQAATIGYEASQKSHGRRHGRADVCVLESSRRSFAKTPQSIFLFTNGRSAHTVCLSKAIERNSGWLQKQPWRYYYRGSSGSI